MFIKSSGVDLFYETLGDGLPLILLHGWGHSGQTFISIKETLAEVCKVYILDLPGFGRSAIPSEPWGVEDYVRVLEDFVRALNIESPVLLGHSLGGQIATLYASRNPVQKLILVNAAVIRHPMPLKGRIFKFASDSLRFLGKVFRNEDLAEIIITKLRSRVGSADYRSASRVMQQTLSRVLRENLEGLLPNIKVPTLLIWGDKDTATPLSDAKLIEKLMPDAGLVVYEGAGHCSFLERRNEFVLVVKHFLK